MSTRQCGMCFRRAIPAARLSCPECHSMALLPTADPPPPERLCQLSWQLCGSELWRAAPPCLCATCMAYAQDVGCCAVCRQVVSRCRCVIEHDVGGRDPSTTLVLSRPQSSSIAREPTVVGEIAGARSLCRNCGREVFSDPSRILAFCSTKCFERYPLEAVEQMHDRDLGRLCRVAGKTPPTQQWELRALAVEILSQHPSDVVNINDPRDLPWYVLTRRGANKEGHVVHRDPEGHAPEGALGEQRQQALKGTPLGPRLGWRGESTLALGPGMASPSSTDDAGEEKGSHGRTNSSSLQCFSACGKDAVWAVVDPLGRMQSVYGWWCQVCRPRTRLPQGLRWHRLEDERPLS